MAKFLNTSGTNYFLEALIKEANERVILISPFLKFSDRIKELLIDKDRLKIDVRVVYGKSELKAEEIAWLKELNYVRLGFCKNLHAKCYMSEDICIITSLNLYEFSQVNNNEMGVLINRSEDAELYKDTYEEAQRIIRISEELRTLDNIPDDNSAAEENNNAPAPAEETAYTKLTTSKLAQKLGIKTTELLEKLVSAGLLEMREGKHYLTANGKQAGGEFRRSQKFGPYFIWPENFQP